MDPVTAAVGVGAALGVGSLVAAAVRGRQHRRVLLPLVVMGHAASSEPCPHLDTCRHRLRYGPASYGGGCPPGRWTDCPFRDRQ